MSTESKDKVRVAVPTGGRRRFKVGLRDVGITLVIALLIVGVLYAFNRPTSPAEGTTSTVPYTGGIPSGSAPSIGQPLSDFQIPLADGGTFRLSDYRGKVVWVNFWASWCPPCRAETPDMVKVWNEQKDRGDFVILGVNYAESADAAKSYVQKMGMTYPIGMDPRGNLATEFRLAGLPSHFLVDKNGILRDIRIGLLSEESMRKELDKARRY